MNMLTTQVKAYIIQGFVRLFAKRKQNQEREKDHDRGSMRVWNEIFKQYIVVKKRRDKSVMHFAKRKNAKCLGKMCCSRIYAKSRI